MTFNMWYGFLSEYLTIKRIMNDGTAAGLVADQDVLGTSAVLRMVHLDGTVVVLEGEHRGILRIGAPHMHHMACTWHSHMQVLAAGVGAFASLDQMVVPSVRPEPLQHAVLLRRRHGLRQKHTVPSFVADRIGHTPGNSVVGQHHTHLVEDSDLYAASRRARHTVA